jgi:hypothetical protein
VYGIFLVECGFRGGKIGDGDVLCFSPLLEG